MTAYEFWKDLRIRFGEDAKRIAFSYMDTASAQARRLGYDDAEELSFCKELYKLAMEEV